MTDEAGDIVFGGSLYADADADGAPDIAVAASLGCGVPTAAADLREGETVLDLGSGAGADAFISARRVGAAGRVIGLDMTDEMLDLARANAAAAAIETSSSSRASSLEDILRDRARSHAERLERTASGSVALGDPKGRMSKRCRGRKPDRNALALV